MSRGADEEYSITEISRKLYLLPKFPSTWESNMKGELGGVFGDFWRAVWILLERRLTENWKMIALLKILRLSSTFFFPLYVSLQIDVQYHYYYYDV